jgi:hypothetical protein
MRYRAGVLRNAYNPVILSKILFWDKARGSQHRLLFLRVRFLIKRDLDDIAISEGDFDRLTYQ